MQENLITGVAEIASSTTLITIFTILLTTIVYFVLKNKGLPPGPTGLPYFGIWPFIKDDECHLQLDDLKKKYGDVFSFTCSGRLYINLGSFKAIREAFITKSEFFGDRASDYSIMNHFFRYGVLAIRGDAWKVARKFFLLLLKERCANSLKTSLAGHLYDSIKTTMNDLKERKGKPLNFIDFLVHECCTILRFTLFGEAGVAKEQIWKINELFTEVLACMTPRSILLRGSFAKYFIFPFMPNYSTALKSHKNIEKIVQGIIDEHKISYDEEHPRDIIDEYFKERDERKRRGDPTAEYFTDKVLLGSLQQFIGDGALLVASFTSLLMSNMLLYPEEQDKLYKEIVEVIGLERQPTIEDKGKLTYFNAYIQESTRKADILPFFPNQECKAEMTIGGYRIPKGAIVFQNYYSCHKDSEVFDEPEKFNPSRYILMDGKRKAEPPILFGLGRRSCIGESYALTQTFLLLTTLIQNFQLSLPKGTKISVETFLTSNLMIYVTFTFISMPTHFIIDFFSTFSPVLISTVLAILLTTVFYVEKNRGLPPGPIGLPYFGYWPFMKDSNVHLQLDRLKKKYGDVFCFGCTGRLYINLGSYKAIREALVTKSECFGERMSGYHLSGHAFKGAILYTNGEAWRVNRKYLLGVIKVRGANSFKTSIAGPLYDSIQSSVNELKGRNGEPLNLIEYCSHRCNTFLRLTMFGNIGVTAEQIMTFNKFNSVLTQCLTPVNMLLCGTFAKYFIFPLMPHYKETVKCIKQMEKIVFDIINEHKETYDSENPRNIIDEYFIERDRRLSKGDPTAKYFTEGILMGNLSQFMGDGVLIASLFTCQLMKKFILHPEEQDKLYKEIVEVVGLDRLPTIEDKSKLTYFNAYMLESRREAEFFPFFPSQECVKETTLNGFKIPKGAIVIQNFYSCHHDPKVYDEPEKFNPLRYIQAEGKKRPDNPIFFGLGKRSCVGESYVLIQSFLIMATLIQNFHLSLPEGANESFLASGLHICVKSRMH